MIYDSVIIFSGESCSMTHLKDLMVLKDLKDLQNNYPRTVTPMTVWYVLGPAGAGKSVLINNVLKKYENLAYLSPDKILKDSGLPYEQAREIMSNIIDAHIEHRKSFITEGTGQNENLYDHLMRYKRDASTKLIVSYIDIDLDIALKRNRNRARVLPDELVRLLHQKSTRNRDLWKDFDCHYIDYKDLIDDQTTSDYSQIY